MIDDKMAKMAVNTLKAYCDRKKCSDCAVSKTCDLAQDTFQYFAKYPLVGEFENTQKPPQKTPKFDVAQKDSADFQKYINEIFLREAEKYELPMNTANSIKWFANGKIKVTFVDDDNKTNYIGVAKCHPDDAFNPEIGIKLAIERAAQDMRKPFIPYGGQVYYYVDTDGSVDRTCFFGSFGTIESQLKVAMGNCFKTRGQAAANAGIMMKRLERAIELLKTLRE
ncbi:hypothetical protein ACQRAB_06985 [Megasphaera elsdenii]|uniref:hypothetical protein n=1 Tax=Megasphaera elsdenii TaxID=907 RepID=UPI003CFCAD73